MKSAMVLNIPHASSCIPDEYRTRFLISDLDEELNVMTDWHTDEIFAYPPAVRVVASVSRLVVDSERFRDDADESMSSVGMGAVYTRSSEGELLKSFTSRQREEALARYYDTHHKALHNAVSAAIEKTGRALIIDCHSFSPFPLPYELDKRMPRADICLGTDSFHTPRPLFDFVAEFFRRKGYSVVENTPFAGTIVPLAFYRKDARVSSLMIELNKGLYLKARSREKSSGFSSLQRNVSELLARLDESFPQNFFV